MLRISFELFGLPIGIISNRKKILDEIGKRVSEEIPGPQSPISFSDASLIFAITEMAPNDFLTDTFKERFERHSNLENCLESFILRLRLNVAEFAQNFVFIHSGAVSIGGAGIIFPAKSFWGKSSLTAALIKAGFDYYSDEFAVLDKDAYLHPFPKKISLRLTQDDLRQTDINASEFGKTGKKPVPIKFVIITRYDKYALWEAEQISKLQGLKEIIPHTIPIQSRPEFSLNVLKKLVDSAIILKSPRGDTSEFVPTFKKELESKLTKPVG